MKALEKELTESFAAPEDQASRTSALREQQKALTLAYAARQNAFIQTLDGLPSDERDRRMVGWIKDNPRPRALAEQADLTSTQRAAQEAIATVQAEVAARLRGSERGQSPSE